MLMHEVDISIDLTLHGVLKKRWFSYLDHIYGVGKGLSCFAGV